MVGSSPKSSAAIWQYFFWRLFSCWKVLLFSYTFLMAVCMDCVPQLFLFCFVLFVDDSRLNGLDVSRAAICRVLQGVAHRLCTGRKRLCNPRVCLLLREKQTVHSKHNSSLSFPTRLLNRPPFSKISSVQSGFRYQLWAHWKLLLWDLCHGYSTECLLSTAPAVRPRLPSC